MLVPAPTLDNHRRRNIVGAEQGGFIGCLFGTSCFELSRDIHTPPVWEDKTVQGEIGEYRQPLLSFDCHDLKSPPCLNSWLGRGLRKCGEEGEMRGSPPTARLGSHHNTHPSRIPAQLSGDAATTKSMDVPGSHHFMAPQGPSFAR